MLRRGASRASVQGQSFSGLRAALDRAERGLDQAATGTALLNTVAAGALVRGALLPRGPLARPAEAAPREPSGEAVAAGQHGRTPSGYE